jgi:hypothetical protein
MTPPINIDGSQVSEVTIDGQVVSQVTIDGQNVLSAIPDTFEDQDLSEYVGSKLVYGFDTTTAYDGSVSLVKESNSSTHDTIRWGERIAGPTASKTASLYFYYGGSDSAGVRIVNSNGDGYMSYYFDGRSEHQLVRVNQDFYDNSFSKSSVSLTSGVWYQLTLAHDGEDGFTADIKDTAGTSINTLTGSETTHSELDRPGLVTYTTGTPVDLLDMQ